MNMLGRKSYFLSLLLSLMVFFPYQSISFASSPVPESSSNDSDPSRYYLLTLRNALGMAVRDQPLIKAAEEGENISIAGVGIAKSQYYPTLNGSTTYTRETGNFGPQPGFPFTIPESPVSYDFYQAQLSLSETLFAFGRRRAQVAQNKELASASRRQIEETLSETILNVEKAYFSVLRDQNLVQVDRLTIKDMELQLAVAKARFSDGVANGYDVLNARVNLSNFHLTEVQDENHLRVDELALNHAMGVIGRSPYRVAPVNDASVVIPDESSAISQALSRRPDLRVLNSQLRAQEQAIRFNQAQFLPTVTLLGNYSFDSEFFPLVYNWSAAATVNVPIFNGFLNVEQVRQSRAQKRQQIDQREALRQTIVQAVDSDLLNLRTDAAKIRDSSVLTDQAVKNLALAEEEFRVGTGTTVAVSQAERDLARARAGLVRDRSQQSIDMAQLKKDMGTNFDFGNHRIPSGPLP
jgi:outer membrane protein TolC